MASNADVTKSRRRKSWCRLDLDEAVQASCPRAEGVGIAIVTSKAKPFAARGLEVVGLEVDLLVGPKDAARPKPAPDPVRFALERLVVRAERALMVGDAPSDLLAGRAAGVRTVAVGWTGLPRAELEACAPDHWVEVPGDLVTLATS
ncbi:MAG: HAD-IA family hydrolase [Myxococcales bacterium]|nr:HAD-IA family hydrolase [Myxococcales bacterium]